MNYRVLENELCFYFWFSSSDLGKTYDWIIVRIILKCNIIAINLNRLSSNVGVLCAAVRSDHAMSQFTLATSTAVHGLKLVVSTAPPFGKLFWSLIFCFSLGGLGFSFYNIIAQYLSFPVVVLTSVSQF